MQKKFLLLKKENQTPQPKKENFFKPIRIKAHENQKKNLNFTLNAY